MKLPESNVDEISPRDCKNPCPVCGDRYHLFGPNSNEFIYNMLFWNPAGPIPAPKPPNFTPAYYRNDPNKQWYQQKEPSN
jgi:hypothetical protein